MIVLSVTILQSLIVKKFTLFFLEDVTGMPLPLLLTKAKPSNSSGLSVSTILITCSFPLSIELFKSRKVSLHFLPSI